MVMAAMIPLRTMHHYANSSILLVDHLRLSSPSSSNRFIDHVPLLRSPLRTCKLRLHSFTTMKGLLSPLELIVAHPDPLSLRFLQLFYIASFVPVCVQEFSGIGLRYSKFAQHQPPNTGTPLPSKLGMLICYAPSFLLGSAFLLVKLGFSVLLPSFFEKTDSRLIVFASALTLHFFKRVLEVLLLHRYSGTMELSVSFKIAGFYAAGSVFTLFAQQVSVMLQPPSIDLMRYGVVVFLVGIIGNFYHHYLLACLRKPGGDRGNPGDQEQRYAIPEGGMFSLVCCPHYLFECIDFIGLAMIGQTTSAFVMAVATVAYLSARSRATKLWYTKKIEGFPKQRKALIPFIF